MEAGVNINNSRIRTRSVSAANPAQVRRRVEEDARELPRLIEALRLSEREPEPAVFAVPAPAPADLATNALRCPFCTRYSTTGAARGLMRHITCAHAGQIIDERARHTLAALERGLCTNSSCGCIRAFSSRICLRCRTSDPPRPIMVGDTVVAPSQGSVSNRVGLNTGNVPADEGISSAMPAERQRPSLSEDFLDDFLERVRRLPPTTVEHIPLQFRAAFCKITIGCLRGMLDGDTACAALEEARSKLLLSPPPKGRNLRAELKCRLSMWRSSNFEELLGYIEEQHRQRQISGRLRRRVG